MSLAQDKYRKTVKNADLDRGDANAGRAAAAGALAGALAPKSLGSFGKRVGGGLVGGVLAVKAVRGLTSATKDQYGERSRTGKQAEKLPIYGGLLVAGLHGRRRLQGLGKRAAAAVPKVAAKAGGAVKRGAWSLLKEGLQQSIGFSAKVRPMQLGSQEIHDAYAAVQKSLDRLKQSRMPAPKPRGFRGLLKRPGVQTGLALAGGIAAADAATETAMPGKKDRGSAALHGLKKGALYGGALAISEPILHHLLRSGAKRLSASYRKSRPILFGYSTQIKYVRDKTYAPPIEAWVHDRDVEAGGKKVEITHRQLIGSALRTGQRVQTGVRRGTGFVTDATRAISGQQKTDSRGRPLKNEWEKAWFKNAAAGAALGAGHLGVSALRRYGRTQPNTPLGKRVRSIEAVATRGKRRAEKAITGTVARVARHVGLAARLKDAILFSQCVGYSVDGGPVILFDAWADAHGWDVRDPRGRSARVFAPGSQQRQRRPKEWHEKVDNIRKIAAAGAVASLLAGGAGGWILRGKSKPLLSGGAAAAMPKPRWSPHGIN